jgi:hypothetical protein
MVPLKAGRIGLAIASLVLASTPPANAAPSTLRGQISVAQVVEMLDEAPRNATARQVLTAYLAGVGESAGVLVDLAAGEKAKGLCKTSLKLDDQTVRQAIGSMAADRQRAVQEPATPIILRDMLKRAGCRMG